MEISSFGVMGFCVSCLRHQGKCRMVNKLW